MVGNLLYQGGQITGQCPHCRGEIVAKTQAKEKEEPNEHQQ